MSRARDVPVPPGLDDCRALLVHEGPARDLVIALKYRHAKEVAKWLGTAMGGLIVRGSVDLVTWAPTSERRRRMRGFDHAELLAEVVARHLELPCEGTLRRLPGPPQTGRTLAERRHGPHFEALTDLSGRSVVVVDDVVTTGATFRIAGSVMKSAGADHVVALASAHPL